MASFQLPQSAAARVALTAGIIIVTTLLQWMIYPWVGPRTPFLFFLPALVLTSIAMGWMPGLMVLLAGLVNASLVLLPMGAPDVPDIPDRMVLLAYSMISLVLVFTCGRLSLTSKRAAEAEQRLNLAQEDAGIGLFEINLVERSIHASPSLWRLIGRTPSDSQTRMDEWEKLPLTDEIARIYHELHQRAQEGNAIYEREHPVVLPDGSTRWLLSKAHFERDPRRGAVHIRGASIDVTERKRIDTLLDNTRAELMQQLTDLQGLHELSTKLLAITDLHQQLQAILETAVDFHGADLGLISLIQDSGMLEVEASMGFSEEALGLLARVPLGTGACGNACSLKRRVVVQDTESEELFGPYRAVSRSEGFRAVHSTPIINLSGEVMGALSVHWRMPRKPTERDIRLA